MANFLKLHDPIPTALITPFLRAPVLPHSPSRRLIIIIIIIIIFVEGAQLAKAVFSGALRFDPFDQRPKGLNLWERQRCCKGTIALCRGACALRV